MMEEGSNVRLVRCPKCENLLSELPDYSVYQCGGCGAVLRAEKTGIASDVLLEKSDDKRDSVVSEKEGGVSFDSALETESNGHQIAGEREEPMQKRTANLISSPSLRTEIRDVVNDFDQNTRREAMNLWLNRSNENKDFKDKQRQYAKYPISNRVPGNDHDMDVNIKESELVNSSVENELGEIRHPIRNVAGCMRSRPLMDQWSVERDGLVAFHWSTGDVSDEGPSNYRPHFPQYSEQVRIENEFDGPSVVKKLENDRTELLRKLDELKDQLSRSCDVAGKPQERVPLNTKLAPPPPNSYGGRDTYIPEGQGSLYSVNPQPFAHGEHSTTQLHFDHRYGHVPYRYSRGLNFPDEFKGYTDRYVPPVLGRCQPPHQYTKQLYHSHFPDQHMDFARNTVGSHYYEPYFHHHSCSCLNCYNKNWQVPPKIPTPVYGNRRSNEPTYPRYYHRESSIADGPWIYNSRGANPLKLRSRDRQHWTRSTSNVDPKHFPSKVVVAHGNKRVSHPIAGGAPFVTCCNCNELLKLPRKLVAPEKNRREVQCGACATTLLFEIEKKGLRVTTPEQFNQISAKVDDGCGDTSNSRGSSNPGAMTSSEDYDNPSYNFHLTYAESDYLSRDKRSKFKEPCMRHDRSSSSSFSEDEESPDSVIVRKDVSNSLDQRLEDDVPTPLPVSDSPSKDHLAYSSNDGVNKYGKRNNINHNDQEKVIVDRKTSRQNSVKYVSVATEMEVSLNGYLNSDVSQDSSFNGSLNSGGVSQDYVEVSKEEEILDNVFSQDYVEVSKEVDRPRINKGSQSFFTGLIKKSFKDFSRSSHKAEAGKSNVYINGQTIPYRVVKRAEKLAGPIQPGEYWYDFRAGFWGVMGQPCLGIIPPFIEEFNYPMLENCAAGNTGIFVNGRELHQKDLDLLAGRGLPTTRDKSYLITICGRVVDEDTSEELDSLGKLAPTVESAMHGFGMKIPRALAQ